MINNIKMSRRVKIINKKETQDNGKIKIYTLTDKLKFCPEVVILAGLLKNTPPSKNNEPDRYRNVISYCQDRIEYVNQPNKCDVFVLPHKFDGINSNNYKKLLCLAKQYNKKLLCFYNDDDDKTYSIDSNVVLYRTSFYKSSKLDNELTLNVLVPDFYDGTHQKELSVGFCGTIFKKNKREELLNYIQNSHLKSDIILRTDNGNRWDFEHNYSQRRKEYFDNMRNTLFTLCDRGYGNYSYRFYETMMMGRIPIIIDTDCVFPFEDKININEIGLVLKSTEIKDKESFIGSIEKYYQENKERLEEIQSNNRKIWEEYYSAEGFVENLLRNIRESKETCIKENKKSAILISSTPKFSFIWDTFFTFLRKHWTDCPYPIHFISTGDNDYLREEYNVITEKLEKDLGFLEGYRYLCKKYMDKYSHFILLQDDFLIERTVNQEIISKYENILFENENIGFIRTMPSPGPKGEQRMFGDVKLGKINKNEDYSFSYQTSFWNLKYFYDFTAPSKFRWDDFNMSKKMRIDKSGKENWGFIRPFKEWNAVYESPIPYRPTAILKGKLMDWAKKLIITFSKKLVTNNTRGDGFGAQYQNIIWDMCYAEKNNYEFEYTPFTRMSHNYNNDSDFFQKKDNFINLKNNFLLSGREKEQLKPDVVYPVVNGNIKIVSESKILKKIKSLFWEGKEKKFKEGFNVAVHVRRPNKNDNRLRGSDTPDKIYLRIIEIIREKYKNKNPKFHIYSQGSIEKFKNYENNDTLFHLDEELEDTFLSLVSADVLVTSASSFSYTAAMLSDNEVYYHKFWHTPFTNWIVFK